MQEICAGIVTFNPNILLLIENINSIRGQFEELIIVDNGSENIEEIEEIAKEKKVILIRNSANYGIAKALNQLMEVGESLGYKWLLSLDQDSVCPTEYYETVMPFFKVENIGIVAPVVNDRDTGIIGHRPNNDFLEVKTCITSGACIPISVWKVIGGYDEKMFIDSVDFDFCYRLRKKGYKIIQIKSLKIQHSVGDVNKKRFFFTHINIREHSAFRYYYIAQNRMYYPRKNKLYAHVIRGWLMNAILIFRVFMFENDKKNKVISIFKGWRNGLFMSLSREEQYEN